MTKRFISVVLALAFVFPVAAQASSTIEPTLVETCKLPNGNREFASFGFPRLPNRLPSSGVINAAIIFVDFPDAVGTDSKSLKQVANNYINKFVQFYRAQSYGKVEFKFDFNPKYYRISKKTTSYQMNLRKGQDGRGTFDYFRDAISAADSEYDFSNYQVVYVIPSNTNREITYGPAIPDSTAMSEDGPVPMGAVAGTDSRRRENSLEWSWLAHETGHLFGIEHPWRITSDAQGRTSQRSEAAVWDLMVNIGDGSTGDFLAWSRFLLGWIVDDQVVCFDATQKKPATTEFVITPAAPNDPRKKLALIKTGENTAIAVEVRVNSGLNKFPKSWEGPIVYLVDTTKVSNEGATRLLSRDSRRSRDLLIGNLRRGQSVKHGDVSVVFKGKRGSEYVFSLRTN